jgi:hypothetical protein
MVDLATDMPKLLPFGPDYGSMSQIRICYQADAKCPKFEAWLAANMEADDVKTFQEWFGSLTLGSSATTKPALNSTTGMKTSLKLCCGALGVALLGAVIMAGADTPTAANN